VVISVLTVVVSCAVIVPRIVVTGLRPDIGVSLVIVVPRVVTTGGVIVVAISVLSGAVVTSGTAVVPRLCIVSVIGSVRLTLGRLLVLW